MQYDAVDGYLTAAACVGEFLAAPAIADEWDQPSALRLWSVGGLAGHLARAVFTVHTSLAAPVVDAAAVVDAVTYYARTPDEDLNPSSEIAGRIRARGVETAGSGATDLLARYGAGLDELSDVLPRTPASRTVTVFGQVLPLCEWLRTRTVEMVVHCDDLAASVGVAGPTFPAAVLDDVIGVLAAVAARRRGPHAVISALARAERAPEVITAF